MATMFQAVDDIGPANGLTTAVLLESVSLLIRRPDFAHLSSRAHGQCDGLITAAPACLESPATAKALAAWMAAHSKQVFQLGPLLPLTTHSYVEEKTLSYDTDRIDEFMENVLKSNGPNSIIFVGCNAASSWRFVAYSTG